MNKDSTFNVWKQLCSLYGIKLPAIAIEDYFQDSPFSNSIQIFGDTMYRFALGDYAIVQFDRENLPMFYNIKQTVIISSNSNDGEFLLCRNLKDGQL